MQIELWKCNERVCAEYKKLNMKSAHVETRYEAFIFMNQGGKCLKVEDIRKEIDD